MAYSAYTGSLNFTVTDSPQAAAPSSSLAFGTTTNTTSITSKTPYTLGGNVVGEVNQTATGVLTAAASGSVTLNLQSLTNALGVTGVILVRLKRFIFWLLSALDDTIAGTACTSVTIGNAGSNPNLLNMGGTLPTFTLTGNPTGTGDKQVYASATAAGITVSASHLNVLITNNDGSHAMAVFYNLAGADV